MSDYHLRELLDKLAKWRPWDNWRHVINTLKKKKTYILQNGARESVKFADCGGRVAQVPIPDAQGRVGRLHAMAQTLPTE